MGWVSRTGLVLAGMVLLIGLAAGQAAQAAPGYWRFSSYATKPPQSQLDESDRGMHAMGRTAETRVTGVFQPAGSGAGSVELYFKNDDVDRRVMLTTLKFDFTTGVDMRALSPGQKIRFRGVTVMGGNDLSRAFHTTGYGKMAAGVGDYFLTAEAGIDRPGSGEGEFEVPNGGPNATLMIYAATYISANGALGGQLEMYYEWVAGPAPTLAPDDGRTAGPSRSGGSGGSYSGAWNTTEGAMTLTQGGDRVTGTYSQDNGRIDGQFAAGGRLTGYWAEDGSAQQCNFPRMGSPFWGRFDWVLSADGRHFDGKWSYCDAEPDRAWTGDRTGGAPGPAGGDQARGGQTSYGGDADHGAPLDAHGFNAPPQPPTPAGATLADNWNLGACSFTDTATLVAEGSIHLTRVEVWFHWNPGETMIGYAISSNGRQGRRGFLRGECDPYQRDWCVGRDTPDSDLPAGRYEFRTDRAGVCQNSGSGGAGFIRAFGSGAAHAETGGQGGHGPGSHDYGQGGYGQGGYGQGASGGYGQGDHGSYNQGGQGGRGDQVDHGGHGDNQLGPQTEVALVDNWNPGACALTDSAGLDLRSTTRVSRVTLWYHWNPGEGSVGYSLISGGRTVSSGALVRAECDPYQAAWCAANATLNLTLRPGRYVIRTARAGVCQNAASGGAGFIKAWGYARADAATDTPSFGDLTGTWMGNDGGTYQIRQDGNRISWVGTSADGGRTWQHDFVGAIRGDMIQGHFTDRPSGMVHSQGDLQLRIVGNRRLEMVRGEGAFSGSLWTR